MNYSIIGFIVLIAIIVIIVLIRRNKKDQKEFEKKVNRSEMQPEEHNNADPR